MNRTTVGDRIVDGVFATLVDLLRDRYGTDTWKIRRHPAVRDAYERFRIANRRSLFLFNMARATNAEILDGINREQRDRWRARGER